MSKWVEIANLLLKSTPKTYSEAAFAHDRANALIGRLRSGGRRCTYKGIRQNLRSFRLKLVNKFQLGSNSNGYC